jgi:dipeptidyl aminopeptidase/acylaminoacyl peptidase
VIITILPYILVILVLLAAAIIRLSWYISNRLLRRTSTSTTLTIPITAIGDQTITLSRTKNTQRPGVFGITGTQGQGIVGPILSSDPETVTRQYLSLTGVLQPNTKVAWNTTVYGGSLKGSLKLPIQNVEIPSDLGELPAWFVPGKHNTWVILVHGASGTREQGLRFFRTLAGLGFPILDITYRGDEGAPASPDGLTHLGDTEWQDVEASVTYATEHGAQHILLYGISLGGTIVETFLERSSQAHVVQAVVLDSPILNWRATLKTLVKKNRLPGFIAGITEKIISMRTGLQFASLDQLGKAEIPTLLFHGIEDATAPIAVSDAFASTHPNVTYHRVDQADHTQCWNADSQQYEAELRSFLTRIETLPVPE